MISPVDTGLDDYLGQTANLSFADYFDGEIVRVTP
jgi:hypothetical protein